MTSHSGVHPLDVRAQRGRDRTFWFVVLFAAIGMFAFLPQVIHGVHMWTWPTVPGRIVSQDVTSEVMYVNVHRYGGATDVNEHRLHVRYAYDVAGQSYASTSIGYVRPYVHDSRAERHRLAVGNQVTVHYDPASPGDAVLETAPPMDAVLWSTLSIAGLAWALRRALRQTRRATPGHRAIDSNAQEAK